MRYAKPFSSDISRARNDLLRAVPCHLPRKLPIMLGLIPIAADCTPCDELRFRDQRRFQVPDPGCQGRVKWCTRPLRGSFQRFQG